MKKYNILSLFDGKSCGQIAINRLGIKNYTYYASEIDKYAMQVTMANYPNTIQLGSVVDIDPNDLPKIDLVIGGSPCQGFSFAGKQLNFEDERSKLFFDFVRVLDGCRKKNPDVKFLLENVKMKKEHENVISRFMGIDPIEINSALVSAQNRKRLYWTNIGTTKANLFGIEEPGIKQPKDKGILLKDILESEVDEKYFLKEKTLKYLSSTTNSGAFNGRFKPREREEKAVCLTARYFKMGRTDNYIKCDAMRGRYKENGKRQDSKGSIAGKSTQEIEIRKDDKTNCLTSVQKDNLVVQLNQSKESGGKQPYQQNRVYSVDHKSPCLDTDSGRKNILLIPEATKQGFTEIKDGGCFDATFIDSKTRRGRNMDKKSNCLTAANYDFCQWKNAKIRRLTPIECERLQTVPDNYTNHVSDSQRYKMLGNGWTIDVITHILKHLEWKR